MGSLFGGGGGTNWAEVMAQQREAEATKKQDALISKQDEETARLKAEEEATKRGLDDRRRRMASGLIGRRSLFSNDEGGFPRASTILGAS